MATDMEPISRLPLPSTPVDAKTASPCPCLDLCLPLAIQLDGGNVHSPAGTRQRCLAGGPARIIGRQLVEAGSVLAPVLAGRSTRQ